MRKILSPQFLYWLWTAALVVLFALHTVHLRADFPNNSPWMDYAKYTDEGWYGKAAIEHYVLGHWWVQGDFNPSAALPVLPALEMVLFRFTGVSLVAVRCLILVVFALNLWLAYRIVRTQVSKPLAFFALTLLSANAFLYNFSRLAILEPLLTTFWLASMLIALRLPGAEPGNDRRGARFRMLGILGLLLCLMVLTKATAVFLLPSIVFLMWKGCGYRVNKTLRDGAFVAASMVLPFGIYYMGFVRPKYVADYFYLFTANEWENPHGLRAYLAAFWYSIHGLLWIDPLLCGLGLALLVIALILGRSLYRNPLLIASALGVAGFLFFIGWHNNMQPRYYQVLAYPVVFAIVLAMQAMAGQRVRMARWATFAAACAGIAISLWNLHKIIYWDRHPEYSWISAARQLTDYIDQHPNGNRMVLSISGDDITLMTHLPAICDDFGTWDLPVRIAKYKPGWYAAWNELDPGTLEDLHTQYFLEQVAVFRAFDDPDRNQLILYKLHPLAPGQKAKDIRVEEDDNGQGGSDDQ